MTMRLRYDALVRFVFGTEGIPPMKRRQMCLPTDWVYHQPGFHNAEFGRQFAQKMSEPHFVPMLR